MNTALTEDEIGRLLHSSEYLKAERDKWIDWKKLHYAVTNRLEEFEMNGRWFKAMYLDPTWTSVYVHPKEGVAPCGYIALSRIRENAGVSNNG